MIQYIIFIYNTFIYIYITYVYIYIYIHIRTYPVDHSVSLYALWSQRDGIWISQRRSIDAAIRLCENHQQPQV